MLILQFHHYREDSMETSKFTFGGRRSSDPVKLKLSYLKM